MKTPAEPDQALGSAPEHAVLIYVDQVDFDQMTALEDDLIEVLDSSDVGCFDGNEIGNSDTTLYMYGRDARELYEVVMPTLQRHAFCDAARVVLRFGEVGAKEETVPLSRNDEGAVTS